ncbi:MAG: TOBE domain-containing protein, partial [Alphaproteobacteria bacterium]|nr:TOBE domain-containing protein [Alphaproteobacteria bacterium]
LEVEVREEGGGWVAALAGGVDVPVEPPADGKPGARRLVLRQEDLALEKEPAGRDVALPARVATVVYQGALSRYIVEVAGRRVSVLAGKAGEFVEGDACHLCWRRGDAIVL